MSAYLLLNFEDYGLNQDIPKTIQPYNPVCLCCLQKEGPMINLETCDHSDYLDSFGIAQLKQFNQLLCLQCHSFMRKIKSFQHQVVESFQILLSGTYTNITVNKHRISNLSIQDIEIVNLPPDDEDIIPPDINMLEPILCSLSNNNFDNVEPIPNSSLDMHFNTDELMSQNIDIHKKFIDKSFDTDEMMTSTNIDNTFEGHKMIPTNRNIDQSFDNDEITSTNTNIEKSESVEPNLSIDNLNEEIQTALNSNEPRIITLSKNMRTALDIIERNNQSFIFLGSQLQFLNGEHLSFLETSLLSKEILTDIPLVPAKNCTDLDNSKLEIETGSENNFYDGLSLSPELDSSEIGNGDVEMVVQNKPNTKLHVKPKIKRKLSSNQASQLIKTVRLSQDELNKERVRRAQSASYLRFKYRCETCLLGFNYQENLEDHTKRKHGTKQTDNVLCEICSQIVASFGAMTEHNYRHYTRYDCIQCGKRYQTYDEATRHLNKEHSKKTVNDKKSHIIMKRKLLEQNQRSCSADGNIKQQK